MLLTAASSHPGCYLSLNHRAGTTVKVDRGARDIGTSIGSQEAGQIGVFLCRPHATDWNTLADVSNVLLDRIGIFIFRLA